jgi:hypothetical protein
MTIIRKFDSVLEKARQLEAAIASTVEGAAARVTGAPETRASLEIVHAIIDEVAREIQPTGRGRYGFPFNLIRVTLRAADARARARLQAVVDGAEPLAQRIEARLVAAGCRTDGLVIAVNYTSKPKADWAGREFHVECLRVSDAKESAVEAPVARLKLAVLAGETSTSSLVFGAADITLGRGEQICDNRGRLVRVNRVAFVDDAAEISRTVSRLHAHIAHDAATGTYRLFDDGSSQGTIVIRNGRGHVVSRGGRGIVLQAGDEILLGRARLAVTTVR